MLRNLFVGDDLGRLGILTLSGFCLFLLLPLLAREVAEGRRILAVGGAGKQASRCRWNENELALYAHGKALVAQSVEIRRAASSRNGIRNETPNQHYERAVYER